MKKDLLKAILNECLEMSEIEDLIAGKIDEHRTEEMMMHMNDCCDCFKMHEGIKRESFETFLARNPGEAAEAPQQVKEMAVFEDPGIIEFGQIWTVGEGVFAVVTLVDPPNLDVQLALISKETDFAGDFDLYVPESEGRLGCNYVVETDILFFENALRLGVYHGRLNEELRMKLMDTKMRFIKRVFGGLPINDYDPKTSGGRFKIEESRRTQKFRQFIVDLRSFSQN